MAFGSASAVGRIGMLRPCFVQACAFGLVSAAGRVFCAGVCLWPGQCGGQGRDAAPCTVRKYGRMRRSTAASVDGMRN